MRVVILTVLLSIMQAAPPVPRQTPNDSNQRADKGKQKAAQHPSPVATAAPSQEVPKKAVGEQAATNQPATPNAEQPIRIRELPTVSVARDWIDITAWIFSGILVGVGIVGICAAYKTLRVIVKQTAAIERQTELQSIQWVALKNWRSRLSDPPDPRMLNIEVDVFNETNFPLTLQGVSFRAGTAKFEQAFDVAIVPRARHTVGFILQLGESEHIDYVSHRGIALSLRGAIYFVGISGKKVQQFGGLFATSVSGTEFDSRSEYERSAKEHYPEEPPN